VSSLSAAQEAQARSEIQRAVRALLARPLLTPDGDMSEEFTLVCRHAATLQAFFSEQAGWSLRVQRDMARLRKLPSSLSDASRPARARVTDPAFSIRRYVLLCLALAELERSDRQITLRRLAERVAAMVHGDPELVACGIEFELTGRDQRRDMVAVVRWLLEHRVLRKVEGEEDAFVGERGDVLYGVDRHVLAWVLGCAQPPSAVDWSTSSGPTTRTEFDGWLERLSDDVTLDSDEVRKRALRHSIARRLLDDPVVYFDELSNEQREYWPHARVPILKGLEEHSGLIAEVRLEGVALVDPRGDSTDVALPEEGTDGHVTLLLAEYFGEQAREHPGSAVPLVDVEAHLRVLMDRHLSHWRKAATVSGAEVELAEMALQHLAGLGLVVRRADGVVPRPAIGRFAVDHRDTKEGDE
jgi:uncharacterized protein (TIGR02678 family)